MSVVSSPPKIGMRSRKGAWRIKARTPTPLSMPSGFASITALPCWMTTFSAAKMGGVLFHRRLQGRARFRRQAVMQRQGIDLVLQNACRDSFPPGLRKIARTGSANGIGQRADIAVRPAHFRAMAADRGRPQRREEPVYAQKRAAADKGQRTLQPVIEADQRQLQIRGTTTASGVRAMSSNVPSISRKRAEFFLTGGVILTCPIYILFQKPRVGNRQKPITPVLAVNAQETGESSRALFARRASARPFGMPDECAALHARIVGHQDHIPGQLEA